MTGLFPLAYWPHSIIHVVAHVKLACIKIAHFLYLCFHRWTPESFPPLGCCEPKPHSGSLMEGWEGESWRGYKVKEKAWFWLWCRSSLSWGKPGDAVCLWQWFCGEEEANAEQRGEGNWWRGRGRAQTLMARGQLDPFHLSRRRKTWLHRQGLQWFWQWQYKHSSCKRLQFSPWRRKQAYQLVVERRREGGRISGERDLKWSPLRNVFPPQLYLRITCRTFQIFSRLLPVPYLITI